MLDDLKAEHGISANDATHRLTAAIIFDLPVGEDRWIGNGMNPFSMALSADGRLTAFLLSNPASRWLSFNATPPGWPTATSDRM